MELDLNDICSNLMKLATTDGPTQAAINISRTQSEDPRIKGDFPIFLETERIIEELNLSYLQDMGNLIVYNRVQRMDNDNIQDEIKKIPVCLGAHLDEITYLVSNSESHGKRVLMPICAAPKRTDLLHPECKIVGFRHEKNGEFCDIGTGSIEVEYVEGPAKIPNFYDAGMDKKIPEGQVVYRQIIDYLLTQEMQRQDHEATFRYLLDTDADYAIGDMVIQNYNLTETSNFKPDSIIRVKALDDRVGCIAILYALKELDRLGIPRKAILTSSEEGVPKDVSWGRLVRPTYEKFCTNDVINLICDGIDGGRLSEFSDRKDKYMKEAVVFPYTSLGKGGGDPGIFSVLRDVILPRAKQDNIRGITTTDYVSRSHDAALMHDFPLIGFVDWVNGKVLNRISHCHLDESIECQQITNIIGILVYTTAYFDNRIRGKSNQIFP